MKFAIHTRVTASDDEGVTIGWLLVNPDGSSELSVASTNQKYRVDADELPALVKFVSRFGAADLPALSALLPMHPSLGGSTAAPALLRSAVTAPEAAPPAKPAAAAPAPYLDPIGVGGGAAPEV